MSMVSRRWNRFFAGVLMGVIIAGLCVTPARALDDEHHAKATAAIEKAIAFLRKSQNADGSWTPQPGPAITALVVRGMLTRPDISPTDPAMDKAINYILSHARPDGGIHAGGLENYNTAICLSALSQIPTRPDAAAAVARAQDYLRGLQWSNQKDPQGQGVDESHPFYGGAGYGRHGRPDMSNTQIMIQGLYDSGLDCNDPAFQRALVFISRCQASDANNAPWRDRLSDDGGFIYSSSVDKDHIGQPQSQAGEETIDRPGDGAVTVLRSYGSMTYAGFKSYIYANLDRQDPRVVDAYNWIKSNYALDHNPGMSEEARLSGHYYYLMTFTQALNAWGSSTITTASGKQHDWANDLVDQLVRTQKEDGSWSNDADRWMEGDANLVTAYALLCLTTVAR